ncbi:tripartite tricarboxylate transporter substrate binding protein [Roseomonas sp. AR75]|uniref:Bug family tripartite tricarboxylate transporter substrate binding protein n=1 Tax=Roseomonas sp. AR75 TaxID=2562311 RepID=UPI0010BFD11F|nr:tripartite tricarboxylate transporter substrate-binding protein [Roseomonas sp. AR75]
MPTRRLALLAVAALAAPHPARAQAWSTRQVRLLVPFAPGGSVDAGARLFAEALGARIGQAVAVENRAGAGGAIGAEAVARAAPDGTLLLWGSSAVVSIAAALRRGLAYDPLKDLAPISLVMRAWHGLLASPQLPAGIAAALAEARAKPGALNFASGGTGSATHLLGERLKLAAGLDLVHVPYRGSGQIYPDLANGRVHFAFESLPVALAQARAGTAQLIGVTAPERTPLTPDTPTLVESGIAGFITSAWFGLLAPSATPAPLRAEMEAAAIAAAGNAQFRSRSEAAGFEVVGSTAQQFAALIADEVAAWREVGAKTGISLN